MKKTSLALLAALSAILVSCGTQSDDYSFQYITFSETIPYSRTKQHPSYSFDINVLYANGADSVFSNAFNCDISGLLFGSPQPDVRAAMTGYIESRISQFREETAQRMEYDRANNFQTPDIDYVYSIRTSVSDGNKKDIINCNILIYEYTGGAHGASLKTCRNYRTDGTLIRPEDYFINGYREKLIPVLEKELLSTAGCNTRQELDSKGFYSDVPMHVPDDFIIKKDSVTFIFNQYDIAPYSTGVVELTIANNDMPAHIVR